MIDIIKMQHKFILIYLFLFYTSIPFFLILF
nr:MAG TPA: hypothetical protein [Caudoviricetes sp.]